MSKRKEELMQYLNTLMQLKEVGVRCDKKIEAVLDELHKEMGFKDGQILSITIPEVNNEDIKKIAKELTEKMKEQHSKEIYPDTVWTRVEKANEVKSPFDTIE